MRIHMLKWPKGARYIDLDHVQEVTAVDFNAKPRTIVKDKDGIDQPIKANGHIRWYYRLAFHDKMHEVELVYNTERYDYGEKENDAFDALVLMKAEYDRFLAAWIERKNSTPPPSIG